MKRESGRNREWKEAIEMRGHLEYEREREKKKGGRRRYEEYKENENYMKRDERRKR